MAKHKQNKPNSKSKVKSTRLTKAQKRSGGYFSFYVRGVNISSLKIAILGSFASAIILPVAIFYLVSHFNVSPLSQSHAASQAQDVFQPKHIIINPDGSLSTIDEDVYGKAWYRVQQGAGSTTWSTWTSLGAPANGGGQESVALEQDGRQDVFLSSSNGTLNGNDLWHNYQTNPSSSSWSGWKDLGRPAGVGSVSGTLCNTAEVVPWHNDRRLAVFILGSDLNFWLLTQNGPNQNWGSWQKLDDVNAGNGCPNPVATQDGRLEFFWKSATFGGNVYYDHQLTTAVNSAWAGQQSLGSKGSGLGTPVPIQEADGSLTVFAGDTSGNLWHNSQSAPEHGFTGWLQIPNQSGVALNTFGFMSAVKDGSGKIYLFLISEDSKTVWYTAETAASSRQFGPLVSIGTVGFPLEKSSLHAAVDGQGKVYVSVVDEEDAANHNYLYVSHENNGPTHFSPWLELHAPQNDNLIN